MNDSYVRMLRKRYPPLSREEERAAFEAYKSGDLKGRDKLVNHNSLYVLKVAHKLKLYGIPLEDLYQAGVLGLMRAIDRFEPERGFKLISYATWFIRAYMQREILNMRHNVRRYKKQRDRTGLFKDSSEYSSNFELSLDTPLADGEHTYLDLLQSNDPPVELDLVSRVQAQEALDAIFDACGADKRAAYIVHQRLYTDVPVTLRALGEYTGLSRECIRQIELKLVNRAREKLAA